MSVKRLADGKWQVRYRELDGRQRARRFSNKAEAVAYEASVRTALNRGDYTSPTSGTLTVAELADRWLDASIHLAPGTKHTYRRDLDRYILPQFGASRVRDVVSDRIQAFLVDELDRLASSSVHRHYRTLRTMFAWGRTVRLVAVNPCETVKPPKVTRETPRFLTVEQVEALASAMPAHYRTLVLVGAYGGLRWGELCGLRRGNVDGAKVTVVEQLVWRDGTVHREPPKTSASRRSVPLPVSIGDALGEHLERFSLPGADGLVFPNQLGRPISPGFRGNVWAPSCYRAGLATRVRSRSTWRYESAPKIHDLRHTAVALAIAAGAHPKVIQARLGHSSITTTLNTYGHLFDTLGDDLAGALDTLRTG